jgi:outer membrane biogenesis lipoprotein LolB
VTVHTLFNSSYRSRFTFYVLHFIFACTLFILAACGGPASTTTQQTVDGLTIALQRPQQLALLQDYEFTITLTDASGQPVEGATLFVEQDMPTMKMQSNQPLGEPLGAGKYRVKGVFTMEGEWRVTVHAKVAGKDYAATFDQTVTPQ